jgi:thymidine phosphorylase
VRKEDTIDHAVGVVCLAKRGDRVERGSPIAEVHAGDEESAARAVDEVAAAYSIADAEPERRPIVLEVLS